MDRGWKAKGKKKKKPKHRNEKDKVSDISTELPA